MRTLGLHIGRRFTLALALAAGWLLGAPIILLNTLGPATLRADDAPAEADAATKKLMAANGLFQRGMFKLAADEYTEFLAQYPQHAEITSARYALAVCYYRLNDFEKAAPLLAQVTGDEKFEQRDEALAVLGHSELSLKHYDKAVAAFDALIGKYPNSKHAELAGMDRAQALYMAGKHQEAAEACEQFLAKYPKSEQRAAAFYSLALARRSLGQNDRASAALTKLTAEAPDSRYALDAMLLAGQLLEAQGKLDAAIEQYRKMVATAPTVRKADALYSLAVALYKAGKYDESGTQLAALLAEPDAAGNYLKPARLQLGMVQLAGGKLADARKTLGEVAKDDPERGSEARYGLAQCDISERKFDSARTTLEALLALTPPPVNALQISLDHAICLMELAKYEEAAGELETFAKKNPGAAQLGEALYRRAFCLHKLGKYDACHALCAQVAAMPASDMTAAATELDGESLFQLARYPDAAKVFMALAANAKDDLRRLRFQLRIGQCDHFSGQYASAVEVLKSVVADPKTAATAELQPAIFLMGDALLQQGKNAEAADAFAQFLAATTNGKSDRHEAMFKRGVALLRANDAGAEAALAQAAQGGADSPWVQRALLELGQLHYKNKTGDPAAELNKIVAANATEDLAAPAAYLLGWTDFDAKRYAEAAARWKAMAQRYPKHPLAADAQFQQGVALKEAGKTDEALSILQAYLGAHPDDANAAKAKELAASCLMTLGKNDQAGAMLASLAVNGSASDAVLYDLAWSNRGQKKTAEAQQIYRRLLKDHPDSKLAPMVRGELADLLYEDKQYAQAAELLEPLTTDKTAEEKTRSRAAYRLGWCYQKLGKNDKAAAIFAAFPAQGADADMAASAALQAGLSYADDGKFDKAAAALADAIAKYPKHAQIPLAMLKLAEAQAELGQYDASANTGNDYLRKYPNDPFAYRAHFGIGWSLENRKQYEPARSEYNKVIAANNSETAARAQFQIGETYLAEGHFEKGLAALLAVEDVYAYPKWSARAELEAGRAFEQLKQLPEARKQYEQLIGKFKDAPEADLARERLKALGAAK